MNDLTLNAPLDDTIVFVAHGVDPKKAYIYVFYIDGVGAYVGETENPKRPFTQYSRNVKKLLANKTYRKSKPDGFRRVHRALAKAIDKKQKISLVLLENWEEKIDRLQREKELRNAIGTLNG